MKIIYVDTTSNGNYELGYKNEDNFLIPNPGTLIHIEDKNYKFRNASVDNSNSTTYLFLVKS